MNKKIFLLLGLLVSVVEVQAADVFPNMQSIIDYADRLPEYVDADNDQWLNPDFTSFHRSLQPSYFRRFLNLFGVGSEAWSVDGFKKQLEKHIKKRELEGLIGDFVEKYSLRTGDHILIWTDLHGAFHSLARCLKYLHEKGIIDNDLKITNSHYLLVFNGNLINHSSYVLETLSVVMRLLEMNRYQVIYLRGTHEDKQVWHSHSLARELKIRAAGLSDELIPINKLVTRFFNTLPLGLYLAEVTQKEIDLVLIANNDESKSGFDVNKMGGFFEKEFIERLSAFKLANKSISKKEIKVRTLIMGEDRSTSYKQTTGLALLGTHKEATAWLAFSSPTKRNRRLYEFFYDAFVDLSITGKMDTWMLTLYNQDVRKLVGFTETGTYNIITGQKIKKESRRIGVDKDTQKKEQVPEEADSKERSKGKSDDIEKKSMQMETTKKAKDGNGKQLIEKKKVEVDQEEDSEEKEEIIVGSTIDLSKSASIIGKKLKNGLDLAFNRISQQGGAGKFLPRLSVYNDEYTPLETRKLLSRLVSDRKIKVFLNSLGSSTNEAYIPYLKKNQIISLFPYTGAPIFRDPELPNIAHLRVGYVDEGIALAEYALDQLKARKMAIFYQNDAFGRGALQGAREVFEARGIKDVIELPYERNQIQFQTLAEKVRQDDPDTIFFFAVTPAAKGIVRQLGPQFLRGKKLIGLSVYDKSFDRFLQEKGLNFLMVRVVPNPLDTDIEIVQEYNEEAKKVNHKPNLISLEAYIGASIFFEFLKKIEPPFDKEKLLNEIKKIKNFEFKGIKLNYNPETHELSNSLWLDPGNADWIKKEVKKRGAQAEEKQDPEALVLPKEEEKSFEPKGKAKRVSKKKKQQVATPKKEGLVFGSTMDLSKSASPLGKRIKQGLLLGFESHYRKNLGIPVRLVVEDDKYTPTITRSKLDRILEKKDTNILIGSQGSASLESYLDLIKDEKVLVLFPYTGAPIFRKPDINHLVHFRGSYDREGEELIEYALKNLEAKKILIFYQNDAFGKGLLKGARKALKKAGISDFEEVSHERNSISFKRQAQTIKKANPDTILFATNSTPIRGLIRQMGVNFFSGKKLLGVSVYEDAFENFIKEKGLPFIFTRMVPDPQKSDLKIAQEYREDADKAKITYDKVSFEAYINARILFDILNRIEGPITKEKIIKAAEKTKNYDFKGLKLDFNPATKELSPVLWIDTGEGAWIEKSTRNSHDKDVE